MPEIDLFESVFRSAAKTQFVYEKKSYKTICIVSDLPKDKADTFEKKTKQFLSNIIGDDVSWSHLAEGDCKSTEDLIEKVESLKPDLICSYRNLYSDGWKYPHSLGEHLDVLIQMSSAPVLILPHPELNIKAENTDSVIGLTDHMEADDTLINYAISFCQENATLYLAHVEDDMVFERYINVISKIPVIDTDLAREKISEKLLKEATDHMENCDKLIQSEGLKITVEKIAEFGHRLKIFNDLIREKNADMLVMHSNDVDQQAMHGMAYPLAIEFIRTPLLMI
ncbi:MAG: hypothetical protein HRT89_23405 [Lentisphaeria bacterium]|nr:universal stress protein [Lentisphaeria bacterium]NQZ71009.1 hypothetical protein [Lentisphaeria bacterium]